MATPRVFWERICKNSSSQELPPTANISNRALVEVARLCLVISLLPTGRHRPQDNLSCPLLVSTSASHRAASPLSPLCGGEGTRALLGVASPHHQHILLVARPAQSADNASRSGLQTLPFTCCVT